MYVNKEADLMAACENDKRITKIGSILRRYHIDELPQLFNVLMGDMSIIGPRPHMVSENLHYARILEEYEYRHRVRPGITGLAQSLGNYGSNNDIERVRERVALDINYIDNWSFGMDMKILLRTVMLFIKKD
jgi:putative colanic acid biosynthesis UDP-glucose lipid carrier transferase